MVPPFVVCRGCPGFGHSDSSRGCRNRQPQLKGSAAAREILCPWTMRSSKTRVPCHHDSLTSGHVRAITSRLAPEARSQPPCARVRAHRKRCGSGLLQPAEVAVASLARTRDEVLQAHLDELTVRLRPGQELAFHARVVFVQTGRCTNGVRIRQSSCVRPLSRNTSRRARPTNLAGVRRANPYTSNCGCAKHNRKA
jgi:hypothetical protein